MAGEAYLDNATLLQSVSEKDFLSPKGIKIISCEDSLNQFQSGFRANYSCETQTQAQIQPKSQGWRYRHFSGRHPLCSNGHSE